MRIWRLQELGEPADQLRLVGRKDRRARRGIEGLQVGQRVVFRGGGGLADRGRFAADVLNLSFPRCDTSPSFVVSQVLPR